MAVITAIEPQKRRPDRVNIDLDGEYAFSLAASVAADLTVGADLGAHQVAALQQRDTDESAYQRALRFISLRSRSELELRTRLRRYKIPEDVLERTLVRLRQNKHADDAAFASAWVENRIAFRPRGRTAMAWELQRKGIAGEVAASALAVVDEPALAYQAGIKRARQLIAADWAEFRYKISAYLARRGFPSGIIGETVTRLWNELHPGQGSPIQEENS